MNGILYANSYILNLVQPIVYYNITLYSHFTQNVTTVANCFLCSSSNFSTSQVSVFPRNFFFFQANLCSILFLEVYPYNFLFPDSSYAVHWTLSCVFLLHSASQKVLIYKFIWSWRQARSLKKMNSVEMQMFSDEVSQYMCRTLRLYETYVEAGSRSIRVVLLYQSCDHVTGGPLEVPCFSEWKTSQSWHNLGAFLVAWCNINAFLYVGIYFEVGTELNFLWKPHGFGWFVVKKRWGMQSCALSTLRQGISWGPFGKSQSTEVVVVNL